MIKQPPWLKRLRGIFCGGGRVEGYLGIFEPVLTLEKMTFFLGAIYHIIRMIINTKHRMI